MSEISLKLKTPSTPNYIIIEMPAQQKQDGFKEGTSIHVNLLTKEQLLQIAEEWKHELLSKAGHLL